MRLFWQIFTLSAVYGTTVYVPVDDDGFVQLGPFDLLKYSARWITLLTNSDLGYRCDHDRSEIVQRLYSTGPMPQDAFEVSYVLFTPQQIVGFDFLFKFMVSQLNAFKRS